MADDWEDFEEKIDQAMCEVMFNDNWREATTLSMVLVPMLDHTAPPAIKQRAANLRELLKTPVGDMTDTQRSELTDELVGLLRFICHQGRDDE